MTGQGGLEGVATKVDIGGGGMDGGGADNKGGNGGVNDGEENAG